MRSVDLGLGSGKRWANANIDAKNLKDMGSAYAWGMLKNIYEIGKDWNPDLLPDDFPGYEQDLLNHKIGHYMELYASSGLGELMKDHPYYSEHYDVAAYKLGGKWRVPSYEDFQDLYRECDAYDYPWADCIELVGPNGNAILLPKAMGKETRRYWTKSAGQDVEYSEMVSTCVEINGPNDIKWLNEPRYKEYYIRPVKEL